MTHFTYGDATRYLKTQLHVLQEFGIREDLIFADEMPDCSMTRPVWNENGLHIPDQVALSLDYVQ